VPKVHQASALQQKADQAAQVVRAGVQVIAAPQLFPTPPALAEQMARALDVERGMTVLEPSAGTGRLIHALRATYSGAYALTAVEVNAQLAERLRITDQVDDTHRADFLAWTGGPFDRIVMNPPFSSGTDIAHILHAIELLKPGGRLVALCADGPRQQKALGDLGVYEPLPEGSFIAEGTGVRVAMLTVDKPFDVVAEARSV
jgi:phospholipid N-methyltransferase